MSRWWYPQRVDEIVEGGGFAVGPVDDVLVVEPEVRLHPGNRPPWTRVRVIRVSQVGMLRAVGPIPT